MGGVLVKALMCGGLGWVAVAAGLAVDEGGNGVLKALLLQEELALGGVDEAGAEIEGVGEGQAGKIAEVADSGRVVERGAERIKLEGSGQRRETRAEMLDWVDWQWRQPASGERAQAVERVQNDEVMMASLERIRIPEITFRDMPLSEVVQQLTGLSEAWSEVGRPINFVLIDPEGRDPLVSITLRGLSLRRILDFIVESVGYEYQMDRDVVVIRRYQGIGHGLETAFYPVSRSTLIRLTGIRDVGEGALGAGSIEDPFAAGGGEPVVDERKRMEGDLKGFLQRAGIVFDGIAGADLAMADGQLIVTQTARNHVKLQGLLRRYREVKQVEIEARFIEVQERNLAELGLEWRLQGRGGDRAGNGPVRNLANAFTEGGSGSGVVIDRPGFEMPDILGGAPVLPATIDLAAGAGDLLSVSGDVDGVDLAVVMRALERQSGNDLLSAPKVTVLSGKTAEIVVAEEFRYPQYYGDATAEVGGGDSTSGSAGVAITAGTPRDFITRNIGVEMEVTPTVEDDDAISLRLRPKVTEFEGFVEYGGSSVAIASDTTVSVPSGFYQPVFSVRRLQTEVTIWDGATVVMGGLTREHAIRIKDKVPLLGDLPLIGRLFRSEGESTQKRNLLVFVTAKLVSPGGSPAFQWVEGVEGD